MQLYRFSPIKNATDCARVLSYIDDELKKLCVLVTGQTLPVDTIKLFAHYEDEHVFLKGWVDTLGENDGTTTPSYYVNTKKPVQVNDDVISYLGVRAPDPYRSQVGCGDYRVEDYDNFKSTYLGTSPYIREIAHPKYEMLELFHPNIDVLGYVVKV